MSLDPERAEAELEDADVVPCAEGALPEVKRILQACLDDDIPAMLWKDDGSCGPSGCAPKGGGCGTKVQVLVREADVERVAALLQRQWHDLAERDGALDRVAEGADEDPEGEPPCPACGTAAPLVEGACSDCGLQLA